MNLLLSSIDKIREVSCFRWVGSEEPCPKLFQQLESLDLGSEVHLVLYYYKGPVRRPDG